MTNLDYLYDAEAAATVFSKNRFSDKKLGFKIFKRAVVLPHKQKLNEVPKKTWGGFGGLVNNHGKRVPVSPWTEIYKPPANIKKISEPVIFLSMFPGNWGHCITYNLSRLWFLKSREFKQEFKHCAVAYAPFFKTKKYGYDWLDNSPSFRRLLEILEINTDSLQPIVEPTQFEEIIFPDSSFFAKGARGVFNVFFTEEYRETVDRVRHFALKNRTPTSVKKIYYFHGARQVGEERLAKYFKSKGYAIIQPEKLSLDEQLNFLINAESFASTLGSCAHNAVFLRDGTETIFIPRVAHFTEYQQAVDQVHPLKVNYVDSTLSIFGQLHKAHCYIISEQLKYFFGDTFDGYKKDDFKAFLSHVKNAIKKGQSVSIDSARYYGKILPTFLAKLKRYRKLINTYELPSDWDKNLL